MSEGLRSGELAAAAGVHVQTLRYYERRGLLDEPDRTLGGHRMYPSEAVTVLRVIKAAQRLGFTLDDVAEFLEAGRHHHARPVTDGLAARAAVKLAEVEAKLADLAVIRDQLRAALDAGCDDLMTSAESECCSAAVRRAGHDHRVAAVNARPGWRERWWRVLPAGLAGVACAACCAVPALVAAGLLAGGGAVGVMLGWLPAAAVLLVVVAVIVLLLPRRDRTRGCGGKAGCGCSTRAGECSTSRSTLAP